MHHQNRPRPRTLNRRAAGFIKFVASAIVAGLIVAAVIYSIPAQG